MLDFGFRTLGILLDFGIQILDFGILLSALDFGLWILDSAF